MTRSTTQRAKSVRERFEFWAKRQMFFELPLGKFNVKDGTYQDERTWSLWLAFKAGAAGRRK